MSTHNPTLLRVGMSGTIQNRTYTVRCRVVLSVRIKGEVYYWNEYILDAGTAEFLTLSFEEDSYGCVWRLFTELSPLRTLSAREAASKRVSDNVDLGRGSMRVTLVNRSRVIHIEGNPPEWLSVGDEADFFNAESGSNILVVSWTGEDVEYYYGATIYKRRVAEAFGLPHLRENGAPLSGLAQAGAHTPWTDESKIGYGWLGWVVGLVFLGIVTFFLLRPFSSPASPPEPPPKQAAPKYELALASQGTLPGAEAFKITGRALVEIGELGAHYDRHEYTLQLPNRETALLLDVATPKLNTWLLLRRVPTPASWTPDRLATLNFGQELKWNEKAFFVLKVQLSRLQGQTGATADAKPGEARYGFIARAGEEWSLVRWSAMPEAKPIVYRGRALTEQEVKQAFVER